MFRLGRALRASIWSIGLVLLTVELAWASPTHFRFGIISWKPRPDISPTTVEFTITNAWRRNASLGPGPFSGPDGLPATGDTITEFQGFTRFFPGDGSVIGSPAGPLQYKVLAFDPVENWVMAQALDPVTGNDTILHT